MPGNSAILEVPITVVPLTRRLGWMLHQLREKALVPSTWISWFAINLGSLPVQPAWTGLRRLKAATMLHRRRDGQVLTIFFHSSELMPGGYPHHPTAQHVDRFLNRLRGFLTWLYKTVKVESLTLSELGRLYSLRRQENGEPVRRLDS
jgi:hypothetical protein